MSFDDSNIENDTFLRQYLWEKQNLSILSYKVF